MNVAIGLNAHPEHRRLKVPCRDALELELHCENGQEEKRRCSEDEPAGVML
jgi:hypothetical protein